jgi:hypothetical protein
VASVKARVAAEARSIGVTLEALGWHDSRAGSGASSIFTPSIRHADDGIAGRCPGPQGESSCKNTRGPTAVTLNVFEILGEGIGQMSVLARSGAGNEFIDVLT